MYESLVFAENKPVVRTTDLNTAMKAAESLVVTPHFTTLGALVINEDATIVNGTVKKITKYGFERFCGVLGIPRPFARKIPEDLLFNNIKRLQQSYSDMDIAILERPDDGGIASIVATPYDEYSYGEMLAALGEKPCIVAFEIGERLLRMNFEIEKTTFPAREVDDLFYVHNFICGSTVKETSLRAFSGLYRTQCSNSYIGPYMGNIKANYMLSKDTRLNRFSDICLNFKSDVYNRMKQNMPAFPERLLNESEFSTIWKSVKTVIGKSEADVILKTSEEERKQILRRVNVWQKENQEFQVEGIALHPEVPMAVLAYDTVNSITERAQAFDGAERFKLEKIGGTWLRNYLLN